MSRKIRAQQNGLPAPAQVVEQIEETHAAPQRVSPRFVRERAVFEATGISLDKLRRDRWAGTGFPFYKVGQVVLYDLDEVVSIIESTRRQSTSQA